MNAPATPPPAPAKRKLGWLNLLIDYGPILVFFLVYRHYSPGNHPNDVAEVLAVVRSTATFIVAALVAVAVSWWQFGRVAPMLLLSTVLIVFFGGLTIALHDSFWIQIKPTIIYLLFAASLLIGVWRGRALLQYLLQSAFEGLDDAGWIILSRNWGWLFLAFAVLNEILRHYFNARNHSLGTWISLKLWLFMPMSFLFTFAHMPMLLKHGLGGDTEPQPN